jgi:hypothetical protein
VRSCRWNFRMLRALATFKTILLSTAPLVN